jgi:hypothetical protein
MLTVIGIRTTSASGTYNPTISAKPRTTSIIFIIGKKYPVMKSPVVKLSATPLAGGGVPRNWKKKFKPKTK